MRKVLSHQESTGAAVLDPTSLPVRKLPPGRVIDLFILYTAACNHGTYIPASRRTFNRVWRRQWREVLRFRKSSTHSTCRCCDMLKNNIRTATSLTIQAVNSAKLLLHLRSQWADREIYWAIRHQAKTSKDVLSIMIDAMDKSKFALPRFSLKESRYMSHIC